MTQKQFLSIRTDLENVQAAKTLSVFLDAPVLDGSKNANSKYMLTYSGKELFLDYPGRGRSKPLAIDFNARMPDRGRNPLLRAMGKSGQTVVDMTAGWCMDALQITGAGFNVVAIERSKLVFCLVKHALSKIHDKDLQSRISLRCGDSLELLREMNIKPDIVYLDPIYPHREKSAASRKNISILRDIACEESASGPDADNMMLDTALEAATRRVVVKRPHYAQPIREGKVGDIRSKLVRFDIYKPLTT